MHWIQNILAGAIAFTGGIGVAGGVFAFISILGIIPRMADRFGLASHIYQFETIIAVGGVTGCIISIFQTPLAIGLFGATLFSVFAGIFVGALAMALAETLKVIPVLCQRASVVVGLPILIVALAFGKALGSLYQLYFRVL